MRTSENTLYTGQTNNLEKRLEQHRAKKVGAKYLKRFVSFSIVYCERFETRGEAMKREAEIKRMTKIRKERLVLTGESRDKGKTMNKVSNGKRNKGGGDKK